MTAPISITNREFLEAIAGKDWPRVPIAWGEQSWRVHPAGKTIGKPTVKTSNYFCVSIFALAADGSFRRVKELFERQFAFVVDDVGTKLNEGALRLTMPPATYELETSPGNFQFGYKLTNGTDARALEALVSAIVDNPEVNPSLKDPGMAGVTRVVRLPIGSNCKDSVKAKNGGEGWPHVLHVWRPELAYSVEELADWLEVDLSAKALERFKDTSGTRMATEGEVDADYVLRFLDTKGMVLDPEPKDNGFIEIKCPWAAEHSDGREEAGYRPGLRGFQCHHGHCESRTMDDLRRWVAENATPEEQARALAEAFGPVDEEALKTEIERAQARRALNAEVVKEIITETKTKWVYIVGMERYGCVSDNSIHTEKSFNRINNNISPYGASGEKTAAAIFLNEMRPVTCKAASYTPGGAPIYNDPDTGDRIFNTWRPSGISEYPFDVADADIAPWLDHIAFMLPDPVASKMFLQWCAFLVQRPGEKINWAFVLTGDQGVGKDIMLRPIYGILGKKNYRAITAEDLSGTYQDWPENQLIVVEELPSFHKRDVYNGLKRYVAKGVPYFWVNKKFIPQYPVPNIQNWFIMSNHDDALALERDDRRYFIYRTPAKKRADDYYLRLVDEKTGVFNDPVFSSKVLGWLKCYDLSTFNPGAAPPMTEDKIRMMEATRHPIDQWLADEFDEGGRFHGRKLFQAQEAVSAVQLEGRLSGNASELQKINTTSIGRWLRRHGWTQLRQVRVGANRLRLWAAPKSPIALLESLGGARLEEKYREDLMRSSSEGNDNTAGVF